MLNQWINIFTQLCAFFLAAHTSVPGGVAHHPSDRNTDNSKSEVKRRWPLFSKTITSVFYRKLGFLSIDLHCHGHLS